ncbi:hypothetical protein HYX12_01825 [Candidatus Woesearchaeota archaeon]|nr:hypothetical protein [Candidatus Woesearchaeota archaeon]
MSSIDHLTKAVTDSMQGADSFVLRVREVRRSGEFTIHAQYFAVIGSSKGIREVELGSCPLDVSGRVHPYGTNNFSLVQTRLGLLMGMLEGTGKQISYNFEEAPSLNKDGAAVLFGYSADSC